MRSAALWSVAWLAAAALVGVGIGLAGDSGDAGTYAGVYVIERALSLDNVIVFLMLFAAFGVRRGERARLLWWGIAAAIVFRALAILGGVALVEIFEPVLYLLGALLLWLAWRMLRGGTHEVDPERSPAVRVVRRMLPVATDAPEGRMVVRRRGRLHATPLLLCLAALVLADLVFALDSVPAALAITRDPLIVWLANAMALLGLQALFVLAGALSRRLRYLQQTLAALLALVALKLLLEDLVHVSPGASVVALMAVLLAGVVASLWANRRRLPSEAAA